MDDEDREAADMIAKAFGMDTYFYRGIVRRRRGQVTLQSHERATNYYPHLADGLSEADTDLHRCSS